MTALTGTLTLSRAVLFEVTGDPNVTPRYVVAGTAGSVSMGGMAMLGKTDSMSVEGAFRTYGNGNTRLILGTGTQRTQGLALRTLDASQLQIVMDLLGHTVIYCDTYGRRIFGAFLQADMMSLPRSDGLTDVNLTIQSITYDEAV